MKRSRARDGLGLLPAGRWDLRPVPVPPGDVTMGTMKKTPTTRKHGYAARAREIGRMLTLGTPGHVHEAIQSKPRLRTLVTFENRSQSYLWTTDRGRSRLIKH